MSLPMVLSMLVNSLYNIVDSFFVAQISEDAMTALSLVYPVQNLITAVGVGFGIGINAVIAFHLGAGQGRPGRLPRGCSCRWSTGWGSPCCASSVCPPSWEPLPSPPSVLALGVAYGQVAFCLHPDHRPGAHL